MRPVRPGDLSAAARALLPLPPGMRAAAADRLLDAADAADRYRRRFGRAHHLWGNGTLRAAALVGDVPCEPRLDDPDYIHCLTTVLARLQARKATRSG
ncbi:DUF7742 family protein [Pseudoponticoccus marisrubri]|uniref:DUF7742 domain-containing protein n=1 Tax=Pseudoponticoccus marisrubri TaxID=1685382 RepID=A0A0W7WN28_9RHOB|nr:hypothetical protein [Pseudoponticoccus marisrubri]KUF11927.1 hypothetical protein AVJ23_04945 [Pseudoponticoccus marisrubri]